MLHFTLFFSALLTLTENKLYLWALIVFLIIIDMFGVYVLIKKLKILDNITFL